VSHRASPEPATSPDSPSSVTPSRPKRRRAAQTMPRQDPAADGKCRDDNRDGARAGCVLAISPLAGKIKKPPGKAALTLPVPSQRTMLTRQRHGMPTG
jgi:hypothetical protein